MTLKQRQDILLALGQEKRMTAEQLARIAYPLATSPLKIYKYDSEGNRLPLALQYPPGYQQTLRILRDLAARKDKQGRRKKPEVKRHPSPYKEYPDLWMLPDTDRLKFDLYQHEIICADVFTAYWGKFTHWGVPRGENLKRLELKPDRYMKLYGVELFLEIDRGTEGPNILWGKIQKYLQYSQVLRRRFHVIFVLQDYKKDYELKLYKDQAERERVRLEKQKKRGELMIDLIREAQVGQMCLFTCQDWINKHPEETILANAFGSPISFQSLPDLYK